MPNRIFREGSLESKRIASIDERSEVLFYRLLLLADDFGRFDARPAIIKGRAFALRDDVDVCEIERRLRILDQAGLIVLYSVNDSPYLEIQRFDQRLRARKSKFPTPDGLYSTQTDENLTDIRARMTADDRGCPPRARARSSESESESESESLPALPRGDLRAAIFSQCLIWLEERSGRKEAGLRSLLGRWCRDYGDGLVLAAIGHASTVTPVDPIGWVQDHLRSSGVRRIPHANRGPQTGLIAAANMAIAMKRKEEDEDGGL